MLAVMICLLLLSCGCSYVGVTAGPDSEYGSAVNFTIEYGVPLHSVTEPPDSRYDSDADPCSVPSKLDWMLTSGFLYIDNGLDLYWYKGNPEMGGFVKLGVEIMPDTGFFVNVLGGVTWIHWSTYYNEGTEWYGLIGGGVTYFVGDGDFCVTAAYDNRRFFNAGVGVRF